MDCKAVTGSHFSFPSALFLLLLKCASLAAKIDGCMFVVRTRPSTCWYLCRVSRKKIVVVSSDDLSWERRANLKVATKIPSILFRSFDSEELMAVGDRSPQWPHIFFQGWCCDRLIELINFLPHSTKHSKVVGGKIVCVVRQSVRACQHSCNCLLMYFKSINFANMEKNIFYTLTTIKRLCRLQKIDNSTKSHLNNVTQTTRCWRTGKL